MDDYIDEFEPDEDFEIINQYNDPAITLCNMCDSPVDTDIYNICPFCGGPV